MTNSGVLTASLHIDDLEYLWNVTPFLDEPSVVDIQEVSDWTKQVIEFMIGDWLPPVEIADRLIESLDELRIPAIALSQCLITSSSVIDWWISAAEAKDITRPASVVLVQALSSPTDDFNFHYALAVSMSEGGAVVIVDFTFSQFVDEAPFPHVSSPQSWEAAVKSAL